MAKDKSIFTVGYGDKSVKVYKSIAGSYSLLQTHLDSLSQIEDVVLSDDKTIIVSTANNGDFRVYVLKNGNY